MRSLSIANCLVMLIVVTLTTGPAVNAQGGETNLVLACAYRATYDFETERNEGTSGTKIFTVQLLPDRSARVRKEGLGAVLMGHWDDGAISAHAEYVLAKQRVTVAVVISRFTGELEEYFGIAGARGGLLHQGTCASARRQF